MIEHYEALNVIFYLRYFKDVSDSSIFRFEKYSVSNKSSSNRLSLDQSEPPINLQSQPNKIDIP